MIQLISYNVKDWDILDKNYKINDLTNPKSFDEFKINIIDLRNSHIWISREYEVGNNLFIYNDLKSIDRIIMNSKKSRIIVILPQNIEFKWYWNGEKFRNRVEFKENLDFIKLSISDINFIPLEMLDYENTTTKIKNNSYEASFYFNCPWGEVLTKSNKSEKATTVMINDIIFTTLDIDNEEKLNNFLYKINLIEDKEVLPQWLESFKFFDDSEQEEIISNSKVVIEEQIGIIKKAEEILKKNNEYKSILYTNGDNLVDVVFKMLQEILNYDLSQFEDDKKEDFVIKKSNITFIGEIKGVTSNVKSEHISQLDVHLQGYLDNLEENSDEIVKSLLIINHQRNTPLRDRQPVHETQTKLATRNESLIIETSTLLRLYEKYLKKELNSIEIENMLINNKGLLIVD